VREKLDTALEATQGQNDSFLSQLPYKCFLFEVAFVWELTKDLPMGYLQRGEARNLCEELVAFRDHNAGLVEQLPRLLLEPRELIRFGLRVVLFFCRKAKRE